MSVEKFCGRLHSAELSKNDRKWFPRWIRRYALSVGVPEGQELPVAEASVIEFSRALLESSTPAWQRLQAVRAVEVYRNLVLQTDIPPLSKIRLVLSRLADQERGGQAGIRDEKQLIGRIDPNEPAILQEMRKELRLRHKAMDTERAYVGWIQRFTKYTGSWNVPRMGEKEIKSFLTHLAVECNVALSTQNQAKSALLFLFQVVMGRELAFLDVTRASKPERLPVVLSREEIALLLPEFNGLRRVMFLVMYGTGLRHKECRRLRVKDICFDEGHIVVRSGKGDKDRITVLPERCCEALRA